MANPLVQYFKDTRTELNHVAWPTQKQTAVFTALVVAISVGVAAYLGALDYAFETALADVVKASGNTTAQNAVQATQPAASSTPQSPAVTGPTFTIPGATSPSGSTNTTTK
jgi:preprotein translocase SecE subunit